MTEGVFDGILPFIMTKHQSSILKHVLNVAFATLLSRVLGLFRVIFESMTLGGSTLASAWQLAFMIPNMFRRLLGEGALGSALIPVLIHTEEKEGIRKMREDLTVVFAVLAKKRASPTRRRASSRLRSVSAPISPSSISAPRS